ncbi:MAG: precorrin-2 C(20)-methyltransferase [Thermosynechococcaceae cyanobacterium]
MAKRSWAAALLKSEGLVQHSNQYLGTLYGIGIGPGDPELITVKGLKYLQQAPIVAFPAGLGDKPGMAERMVQPWLYGSQVQLPLRFPYVQDQQVLEAAWVAAAEKVWTYLSQSLDVAFVSEGDVSFYSTFSYLAQTLLQRYPQATVETIPGICSPLAAAAVLGIPLTLQGDRLAVIPSVYHADELTTALDWADVVVLMKVHSVYRQVWEILRDRNLLERSSLVIQATGPEQKIYRNLQHSSDVELPYFSILVVQVKTSAIGHCTIQSR